jgi:HEAT repeat protein
MQNKSFISQKLTRVLFFMLVCCIPTLEIGAADHSQEDQRLSGQLLDPSPKVVAEAAFQIGNRGDQFEGDPLVAHTLGGLLTDKDKQTEKYKQPEPVREAAAYAIGRLGPKAAADVPLLLQALDDPERGVVRASAEALGRIGDKRADVLSKLNEKLVGQDTNVKSACLEALSKLLPRSEAASLIFRQVQEDNVDLTKTRVRLAPGVLEKDQAVSFLSKELRNRNTEVQQAAAYEVGKMGPDAIDAEPGLLHLLDDPGKDHKEVRQVAAWALGLMGPAANNAVSKLVTIVRHDTEPIVRRVAADALGSIGSGETDVQDALASELEIDTDLDVKNACATALAGIGTGPKVATALFMALHSDNPAVQLAAVSELAKMDPQPNADVTQLLNLTDSKDLHLREAAVQALGHIHQGGRNAIPRLISYSTRDPMAAVRIAAVQALGEYSGYLAQNNDLAAQSLTALAIAAQNGKTHSAASQSIQTIADALRDRLQSHPTSNDADLKAPLAATLDRIKSSSTASDPSDIAAIDSLSRALNSLEKSLFILKVRTGLLAHPSVLYLIVGVLLYCSWILVLRFILLRYVPLRLISWNEVLMDIRIELPQSWGGLKLSLRDLLLLKYFRHARVLEAWVFKHAPLARLNFTNKDTYKLRANYFPLPLVVDGEIVAQLSPTDLLQYCDRESWCLRIIGEGGAGKTSLACQLALWAIEQDPEKRLSRDRQMIPVLLERSSGESTLADLDRFKATVRALIQNITGEPEPIPEWLSERLLRDRRVLVIVDGLSEFNLEPHQALHLEPNFPVTALIVTSRSDRLWAGPTHTDLHPLRIDSNHLSSFMNAYLGGTRNPMSDAELYEACRRLADLVGSDRSITPLLAKLYAEQLARNQQFKPSVKQLPDSIPGLVLGYLNAINRDRAQTDPNHTEIHRAAEVVAWECCKESYQAGYARKTTVSKALTEDGFNPDVADYLEQRLQIIRSIAPAETHVEFASDSIAEYLAGLRLIYVLKTDQEWHELLSRADKVPGGDESVTEFFAAVWDCCKHSDADLKVSDAIMEELFKRGRQSSLVSQ